MWNAIHTIRKTYLKNNRGSKTEKYKKQLAEKKAGDGAGMKLVWVKKPRNQSKAEKKEI
jgi:hypothetical protein